MDATRATGRRWTLWPGFTEPVWWVGALAVGLVLAAVLWPERLAPYGPEDRAPVMQEIGGRITMAPYVPGPRYLFGTDDLGRDLLSRIVYGARRTLPLALLTAAARIAVGTLLGWVAIRFPGDRRSVVLALAGISAAMPGLFFAYLVIAAIGPAAGLGVYVLGIGLTGWAPWTQLVFQSVRRAWAEPYMEGATAAGATTRFKVRHYLWPHLLPVFLPAAAQEVGTTLLLVAELGFVGIYRGVPRLVTIDDFQTPGQLPALPAPEWGGMLAGTRFEVFTHYWIPLAPAVAFAFTIFAFYALAEGLRAAWDMPGRHRAARPASPRAVWQRRLALAVPALLTALAVVWLVGQQAARTQAVPPASAVSSPTPESATDDLLRRAQTALNYGQFDLAEERFRAALAQSPADPDALAGLQAVEQGRARQAEFDAAKRLTEAGEWAAAFAALEALAAEQPDYPGLADLLAEAQQAVRLDKAERAYAAGDWATAVDQYQAIRDADPAYRHEEVIERLFDSLVRQADALLGTAAQDFSALQDALALYDRARPLRPRDETVTARRARLQTYLNALAALGQGDRPGAAAQLAEVWQQEPDFAGGEAARRLASVYLELGQEAVQQGATDTALAHYADALAICQQARHAMPDLLVATLLALADAQQQTGDFAAALETYEGALALIQAAPSAPDLLARIGRPPSLFAVLVQWADASAAQQDWHTAAALYRRALTDALPPDSAPLSGSDVADVLTEGEAAEAQGDDAQAVAIYRQAITTITTPPG